MEIPSRTNNFDLARLFGALLVIYGHSYPLTGNASPGFAANGVATIGVKIFFSISGYLIAKSWLRDPDVPRFFARRAVRIFPALITVVLLTDFVLGPLVSRLPTHAYFLHPTTLFYLKNIVLYINYSLPGVFEANIYPNAVNGSLWSLPVEVFMYVMTPLLIAAVVRTDVRVFALIFVAVTTVSLTLINVFPRSGQWVIYATDIWSGLSLTPYFLCGMLFAVCKLDRLFNIYVAFGALFVLAVVAVDGAIKELLLILILPYACLSFSVGSIPGLHRFSRGVDLSYGMFLYGFPIQQMIVSVFGRQTPWHLFMVSSLISAVLAFLSWHLVEKRALQWKPSARRPSTDSSVVVPRESPNYRLEGSNNRALEGLDGG